MLHTKNEPEGDHETEEYMAFTCYLLLNTDYNSLKLKNVPPSYERLYSCVFLFIAVLGTLFTVSSLGLRQPQPVMCV